MNAHDVDGQSSREGRDQTDHHKQMVRDFRFRFFVSLILSLPVLALSPLVQELLWIPAWSFPHDQWVVLLLSTAIFGYGGWPFLTGAYQELRSRHPGMMTLVGLAITVAFVYSVIVFADVLTGRTLFWELVTLIDVMLIGHWIEMTSVLSASRALEELGKLLPNTAHRVKDKGNTEDVSVSTLEKGDTVLVKPGEHIPVDGVVVEGVSSVNEAMVTGESEPVRKEDGTEVIGGTINGNGSLTIRVEKTGADTYLSQITRLVKQAQQEHSPTQTLADRAAAWLTGVAIVAGAGTLLGWLYAAEVQVSYALERTIAVVVIACPHALGLAIPLVVSFTTSLSAKRGILIRDRGVFERVRHLDAVIFDKTGTLTKGEFSVSDVEVISDTYDEQTVRDLAASVEAHSEHPVAQAITAAGEPRDVRRFEAIPGEGVQAQVYDDTVVVANRHYCHSAGKSIPDVAGEREQEGKTVSFIIINGEMAGVIALTDTLRPSSREAVRTLQQRGVKVMMITGDNDTIAQQVATELGLDDYRAHIKPEEKAAAVADLKQYYGMVAMVGDGINDAPALARADVGIAVGAGTDVAIESAHIVLVKSEPLDVVRVIDLSEYMHRKMLQNLWWASGYNIIALPLAAGALAWAGLVLSPAVGAILMSASTVIVAVNAMLMKVPGRSS